MRKKNSNDNVIYVNGPEEARENNAKAGQAGRKQKKIMLIMLIIFIAILTGFIYYVCHRRYKGYKVIALNETNYEKLQCQFTQIYTGWSILYRCKRKYCVDSRH